MEPLTTYFAWLTPFVISAVALVLALVSLAFATLARADAARQRRQASRRELPPDLTDFVARLERLESELSRTVSRTSLVRFDAFPGSGGHMSFCLALLDQHGDGALFTAIAGRDETRLYAKAVRDGTATVAASPEELEAVREALGHPDIRQTS